MINLKYLNLNCFLEIGCGQCYFECYLEADVPLKTIDCIYKMDVVTVMSSVSLWTNVLKLGVWRFTILVFWSSK